jgi:hypothetical protein
MYSADDSLDPITIGETHPVLANPSSGVEASSSASLAAYLNSLQFSVEESQAWFGKGAGWHVSSGVYCCFNAFSRVDVRVDVKIPGGVDAYIVDLRGER